MTPSIAIVGLACRYPDATSPAELWENVLAQRRAFRRMPAERMNPADYYSADKQAPDRTYSMTAAVIEDYEFDRVRFRISGSAYRSADLAHWLALDIGSRALADAGFPEGEGLPRSQTAVYLGNTLTGEFSRAAAMRLRWPFVRRVVGAALANRGMNGELAGVLRQIEEAYKRPFADVGEETLAGGLSNTIAGRITSQFDLKGGGYTVDGACASSLLAVATACSALAAGDCDVALAGGVDLSLDPFELVGFAKAGALAQDRMRVYDERSAGFWPGEGCGFAVLMRHEDALAMGRRVYALIRGWGISSDGSGGITRPEVEGQLLALERAYRRAGFGPDSVAYFEGHGTGTAVGDSTELRVVARARREAGAIRPAAIGSIKANIGHTKAAAGIAGLLKAAMAVHTQVVPPATGCERPHAEMNGALTVLPKPQAWPTESPVRAAVSAMGFGGINSHIVLEGASNGRRSSLSAREERLSRTPQDAELFLFHSPDQIREVSEVAASLSLAELTDLAACVVGLPACAFEAAVVASTPQELSHKLESLTLHPRAEARIGFLFPGQGSQNASASTEEAQPAIVRDSLAALRELRALGIEAGVAVGHSLGEITALCWAGALDEDAALRIAAARGRFMAAVTGPAGAMASIGAGEDETRRLIEGIAVVIAGLNAERQTVISGEAALVSRAVEKARVQGLRTVLLPVSHAFHSPLVEAAATPLVEFLQTESLQPLQRRVVSTVTGAELAPDCDLRDLLHRQITMPVRFRKAVQAAGEVDLWIEVGPGRVLSGFVQGNAVPVESGTGSRRPFLEAVAAAVNTGAAIRAKALFDGRFVRPFKGKRKFFVNPCELAPAALADVHSETHTPAAPVESPTPGGGHKGALAYVRELVAERAELPESSLHDDARLLADLHLNSIVVAQIAAEAARRMGIAPPPAPLEYAGLSIAEMARSLEAAAEHPQSPAPRIPAGVDAWVRPFTTRLVPRPLRATRPLEPQSSADTWQIFGNPPPALAQALPSPGGVLLWLPPDPGESLAGLMLDAAKAAQRSSRFVVVQHGGGGAALARTVFLEARDLAVCVVDLPAGDPRAIERIAAEAAAARNYTDVHYPASGQRSEPVWAVADPVLGEFPLHADDVLLVTGGGRGIGAECAIEAGRVSGAKLAILGTADPAGNAELATNLDRMRALGLRFEYFRADVLDAAAVAAVFRQLGRVTAILHCAGINHPRSIESLVEADFRHTVAVKVDGLRNLLAAADPAALKLLAAFGSIIGRMGLQGEADYAVANDWLERRVAQWGAAHPQCRCLTLEWSVWSGTGMGTRVAQLEQLIRAGISPISIEEGIQAFRDALGYQGAESRYVVAGRFGLPPTVQWDAPELPLLRFLERTRVHYPRVELVAEADLSTDHDPYLEDHVFGGARLFPGVMALEAMAQTAMAVAGSSLPPAFEQVRFLRPVIVPREGTTTLRLAALARGPNEVEVCLRSSETGFQTDHFRAVARFRAAWAAESFCPAEHERVPLDPERDLYGSLLFQRGRFHRLRGYRHLTATECLAEAASAEPQGWFNRYLPQTLVLGDAGVRDTALHAIQACIPHAQVLPGGAAAIAWRPHERASQYQIHAREIRRDGDLLVYDLAIATDAGEVVERWTGLELRIVTTAPALPTWPPALLAPYLERRIAEIAPLGGVAVAVGANGNRNGHGRKNGLVRRPDGKPLLNGSHISRSHARGLVLTVTAPAEVGCDCEPVTPRSAATWRDLLGPAGFALAELVAREIREDLSKAATRVWCALECMKKAGARQDLGILLSTADDSTAGSGGWVVLGAGSGRIATLVAPVAGFDEPLAFAVLVNS